MTKEELIKELELLADSCDSNYALEMNGYNRGVLDALSVVNKYFALAPVMPSLPIEKLKQIKRIADDVYHDLVSSNHPTHDEWCSSPKNLKVIMLIVDKLLGNEA